MKLLLRISFLLNLTLTGGLIFLVARGHHEGTAVVPVVSPEAKAPALAIAAAPAASSNPNLNSFRWSQLEAARSYRAYIANLRAIGCPEPTVEDIVRGDANRAFSWQRNHLGIEGSGNGPWSRSQEIQLVASLLGAKLPVETTTLARDTGISAGPDNAGEVAGASASSPKTTTGSPSYPLFLQNVDWKALGFSADDQAAIAQVRQQFQSEIASLNQNSSDLANTTPGSVSPNDTAINGSGDTSALTHWQKALQDADSQLRGLLGAQGYMAYQEQQYDAWYQTQVAAAHGGHLTINLAAFSLQ